MFLFLFLFSAFWIIITLLAAPKTDKFPAIVLPADSAVICASVPLPKRGRYKATGGTFEIN